MAYFIDKTVLGIMNRVSESADLDAVYQEYDENLTAVILATGEAFLEEKGITVERIHDFWQKHISVLGAFMKVADFTTVEAQWDALMNNFEEQYADIYPLLEDGFFEKVEEASELFKQGFYEAARKDLTPEEKQKLNTYLDQIEIQERQRLEGIKVEYSEVLAKIEADQKEEDSSVSAGSTAVDETPTAESATLNAVQPAVAPQTEVPTPMAVQPISLPSNQSTTQPLVTLATPTESIVEQVAEPVQVPPSTPTISLVQK